MSLAVFRDTLSHITYLLHEYSGSLNTALKVDFLHYEKLIKNSKKNPALSIKIRTIPIRTKQGLTVVLILHSVSQDNFFTYPNIPTLSEAAYIDWNFACSLHLVLC